MKFKIAGLKFSSGSYLKVSGYFDMKVDNVSDNINRVTISTTDSLVNMKFDDVISFSCYYPETEWGYEDGELTITYLTNEAYKQEMKRFN